VRRAAAFRNELTMRLGAVWPAAGHAEFRHAEPLGPVGGEPQHVSADASRSSSSGDADRLLRSSRRPGIRIPSAGAAHQGTRSWHQVADWRNGPSRGPSALVTPAPSVRNGTGWR